MENKLLYEGKAKKIFSTENPDELLVYYKDDATAGNGAKKGTIADKGILNNKITNFFFGLLEKEGIKHHLIKVLNDREILVKKLDIVPLEVIIRNVAAGSLAKRLGLEEGVKMSKPVIEYCYKCDDLGDPMVNRYHITAMGWATDEELLYKHLQHYLNHDGIYLYQVFHVSDYPRNGSYLEIIRRLKEFHHDIYQILI